MFGALRNKAAAWPSAAVQHLSNTFLMDSDNLIAKAPPLLTGLLSFISPFTGSFFPNVSPPLLQAARKRPVPGACSNSEGSCVSPSSDRRGFLVHPLTGSLAVNFAKQNCPSSLSVLLFISSLNPQISSSVKLPFDVLKGSFFQCKSIRGSGLISSKGGASTFSYCI